MARINNLTNFLVDVATAIKTKKGSQTNIPAADFDTEIINLPSSGSKAILPNGTRFAASTFTSINLSAFDASQLISLQYFLSNCPNVTSFDLNDFNANNATDLSYMFSGCTNLTSINFDNFDTSNATTMQYMFSGCTNLTSINLNNFNLGNCTGSFPTSNMFNGCPNLSNESLNSILKALSTSNQSSRKTLKNCGLTSEQATICTGLSNYQAFVNAGWTTGY